MDLQVLAHGLKITVHVHTSVQTQLQGALRVKKIILMLPST